MLDVLLGLEAYSLPIGSVLLFSALALVMYDTRKIDWSVAGATWMLSNSGDVRHWRKNTSVAGIACCCLSDRLAIALAVRDDHGHDPVIIASVDQSVCGGPELDLGAVGQAAQCEPR